MGGKVATISKNGQSLYDQTWLDSPVVYRFVAKTV
jgi:hypothetical protein